MNNMLCIIINLWIGNISKEMLICRDNEYNIEYRNKLEFTIKLWNIIKNTGKY